MALHGMVLGLPRLSLLKDPCHTCLQAKHHRSRIPQKSLTRATRPFELIHSDLYGPIVSNFKCYVLTFIDDFSRYTWIYFLLHKRHTLTKFCEFTQMIPTTFFAPIGCLCSDRGGEYLSHDFTCFFQVHGITRQLTSAHTPHQNDIAEHKNRSLIEMARSIFIGASFPLQLWIEPVKASAYILNRITTCALNKLTPFEALR